MVDHVKALGYKITFPKILMTAFGFYLVLHIGGIVINELSFIQTVEFESTVLAIWLGVGGIWLIIEGIASTPDAKRGTSKVAVYIILGLGLIAFTLSFTVFFAGVDLLQDTSELAWLSFGVLLLIVILWFGHLLPELHSRKSFVRALN